MAPSERELSPQTTEGEIFIQNAFSFSYFSVKKSTKSHQRERSPLFANSPPCLGDANQRTACIG